MMAELTGNEIAKITGLETKDFATIRIRYASYARVVIPIGERIGPREGWESPTL